MNDSIEIIKYITPLIILIVAVLLILKHFSDKEKNNSKFEIIRSNNKILTPIRLQAYERLTLFLERIKPDSLALRLYNSDNTSKQAQMLLTDNVKKEFNHNLSQQVYISDELWQVIVNAKEQLIRIINLTGTKPETQSSSAEFSRVLIEVYNDLEKKPIEDALLLLKKEASLFFGM
jgi:hypothetical protein